MSKYLDNLVAYLNTMPNRINRIVTQQGDEPAEFVHLRDHTPCLNTYSIAKMFTMTAIGMLWDRGQLKLDEIAMDILGDWCPADHQPQWRKITVRHLLTHTAGLPGRCLDIDMVDANEFKEDYIHECMTLPMVYEPGEGSRYTDGAYYMLSCIVEKKTGMALDDFLWKELFRPMGFRDVAWSHCPHGHAMGATGLYTRIDDVLKIGKLYLDGGVWGGRRFVSQAWVDMCVSTPITFYHVGDHGAYAKGGMFGQTLLMLPHENRVVAWCAFGSEATDELELYAANHTDE